MAMGTVGVTIDEKDVLGEEVSFKYANIKDLAPEALAAFRKIDSDEDGAISLSEMLHLMDKHHTVKSDLGMSRRAVAFLALSLVILIASMFASSFTGVHFFKDTKTDNQNLVAQDNSNDIIKTAQATVSVPLSLSTFLNTEQLTTVKEVALTNFQDAATPGQCAGCPAGIVLQTTIAVQYNETYVKFLATNGVTVTVDKGMIQVTGLPGFTNRVLGACGSATCSTVKVDGVDLAALQARAAPYRLAQRRAATQEEDDEMDAVNDYYGDTKVQRRWFTCW